MKRNEKELIEYTVLIVGLLAFFILLILFRFDRPVLNLIALLGSIFYFLWGIFHHAVDSRLSKALVVEYLFISAMVYLLFHLVLIF
jgi:hypothetical protein